MKISLTYLWFPLLLLIAGCSKKEDVISDPLSPKRSLELKNEKYGGLSNQEADIFLPANRTSTSTKVIVLIHGGSWISGDKSDLVNLLPVLKTALPGVAFVNMNYSLADGTVANRHPAQMNDIRLLLEFLSSKSNEWNISSSHSLLGVSAGGHLGLLYAYAYAGAGQIRMVASIVGPTNLTDPFYTNNPLFQNMLATYMGKTYAQDPALYEQLSPALRMGAGAPATYLAYGGSDPLVPTSNPALLEQKLKQYQVKYKYDFLPQESHEFSNAAIAATVSSFAQYWRQQVP